MSKKFKDTKVGKFLTGAGSKIVDIVGNKVPIIGDVIELIEGDAMLTEEQKLEAKKLLLAEKELELKDRESARIREVEIAKAGGSDILFKVTGFVVLALLIFTVVAVFFFEIENKDMAHFIAGEIVGLSVSVVVYYFGTSKSSSDKTKELTRLLNK